MTVGNATQPFTRLIASVIEIANQLPQPVIVQHGSTAMLPSAVVAHGFVDAAFFEKAIAGSQLLIMHAGAGSIIHAMRARRIPVVMPRRAHLHEHVDDHQVEFAQELARQGRVIVADSTDELRVAVEHALRLQGSAHHLSVRSEMIDRIEEVLRGYEAQLRSQ